ncbi:MAG: acyl-CoA dehydrogenase family protein, partial [Parahaliea sp.]
MHIDWSTEDLKFQQNVHNFLANRLTPDLKRAGKLMTSVYADHQAAMRWQCILGEQGWIAPSWPVEYGGCDWSVTQHYIFNVELARAGAPPVSPMGIQMCGPALIGHGTPEQKAYYLPRMLSGEHFWCQGYSEPGAGSDLAALQMSAREDGDSFVCNGSKIWTTHASEANWIFCLVRTARMAKPQQGITFLLIDMNTPCIEVQAIISPTGEHIQNVIFFNEVRVPRANVVGEINQGWTVAKYLMEFERGGAAYAPLIMVRLDELAVYAASVRGDTSQ